MIEPYLIIEMKEEIAMKLWAIHLVSMMGEMTVE
jgi:hypothetical protein